MDGFIHRENLRHFRNVLKQTTDEAKREQVLRLLAEEEDVETKHPPSRTHGQTASPN
jgi:hypothetical protein